MDEIRGDETGGRRKFVKILIIAIVVVLLVIAGWVIYQAVKKTSEDITDITSSSDLEILEAALIENETVQIIVQRNSRRGDLVGINFNISDGENFTIIRVNTTMQEKDNETFTFSLAELNLVNFVSVSIAPIYLTAEGDETIEVVGETTDTSTVSSGGGGGGGSSGGDNGDTPVSSTCDDEIMNQDETGVDCGGICDACATEGNAESIMLAGVPLIHDQTFLIPENSVSGDTIGDLNLMWVDPSQNFVFSLVDDDGRFSIQRLTGRNTVSNHNLNYEVRISVANADFDYDSQPQRQITIRAIEQSTGNYRDAIITIKLSKTENTIFIDPDWTGCHDGTKDCPYVSWRNISGTDCVGIITPGWTYLQKRDSIYYGDLAYSKGFCSHVTGTLNQHIVLGAYGAGDRPVFDGKDILPEVVWWYEWSGAIYLGSDSGTGPPISYYDIYSLKLMNWWGGILVGNEGTNQSTFTDIYISQTRGLGTFIKSNESNDGQNDSKRVYSTFDDCYSEYSGYPREEANPINRYGFKTGAAAAVNFTYCVARFNKATGFSGAGNSNNEYKYSQSLSNGHYGIKAQGNNLLIDHVLISNHSWYGIKVGIDSDYIGFTTSNLRVTNSIIRDNPKSTSNTGNGMYIGQNSTNGIIENNEFYNNHQAITFYHGDGVNFPSNFIIRNNKFHNNNRSIRMGSWSSSPYTRNITIAYNLFYDNAASSIYLPDATDIKIYNNVFYNNTNIFGYNYDIYMRLNEPLIVKNNLLEDGISTALSQHVSDHNLDRQDSFFVDVSARDFHLVLGSPAIDAGVDVGLIEDFEGNSIVGVPDIGAYEFS